MPKLAVIMAVYNNEKTVSLSIESILNQTYKDFTFYICDDGSKDNSYSIIKRQTSPTEKGGENETGAS